MAIEVFNRYEDKYLICDKTYEKLQGRIKDYMELDEYNKKNETYTIRSIYYDTSDHMLIRTSLKKPRYKEKLRLRSYGDVDLNSKVYIEIKKKVNGLVNKRRSAMRLDEAYRFLEKGEIPIIKHYINKQVVLEIDYILKCHELKPMLYLAYDRRAYFGEDKNSLRVSFDKNIISRRKDVRLESNIYGESLLEEGKWLMEVKVERAIPFWLARLLSEYKIYPTSYSKYGEEFKNFIADSPIENKLAVSYDELRERKIALLPV